MKTLVTKRVDNLILAHDVIETSWSYDVVLKQHIEADLYYIALLMRLVLQPSGDGLLQDAKREDN